MSPRDLLKHSLERRVVPSAKKFARELYARLDPRLIPELGMVIVPTRDVDWDALSVGVPQGRADVLLKDIRDAVDGARQAHETEAAEKKGAAQFFGAPVPGYFASKVVRERNEAANAGDDLAWFSGSAARHFGFDLIVMVGVLKKDLDRLPHVERGERKRVISLVRSVTATFLHCAASELSSTEALFRDFYVREDADDLLRDAGERLVFEVSMTLRKNPLLAGRNVFERINQIAALHYESSEGRGLLVLAERDDETVPLVARFKNLVPIADPVWARKMVELCTKSIAVASDDHNMFGLVRVGTYGARFCVEFVDSKTWRLRHDSASSLLLMEVVRGVPRVPRPTLSRDQFDHALGRIFAASKRDDDALWSLVEGARKQAHGTMLVISANPGEEAKRLASQATPIAPVALDATTMDAATRIDGSVLVDLHGICHAVGVILDGDATPRGMAARGARFNSALRYTTSANRPASLAVVVSEDGHVDLLPRLRPQIRRSELSGLVELARSQMEGETSAEVTAACCRLTYFYDEYVGDEHVEKRASDVAFLARGFGSDDPIWGTFDRHQSDIID